MKGSGISWPHYLFFGFGRRLSILGERIGWDPLIYNPIVMLKFNEESSRNAVKVAPVITQMFPAAETFLDVGSGSGALAGELKRRGCEVAACERSRLGRFLAARKGVDCRPFNLDKIPPTDLPGRFDVVTCFEVAEHLSPERGDKLIDFICARGGHVIFTAAQPGQGGTGHINEQPKRYWIEQFGRRNFTYDAARSAEMSSGFAARASAAWFPANVCVFCPPIAEKAEVT